MFEEYIESTSERTDPVGMSKSLSGFFMVIGTTLHFMI